ncbi:hypothetical protein BGZ81_011543 [Podila clonocystis]|nr:hypothetical protein BGZ81_011543 [Podila clonocystis]
MRCDLKWMHLITVAGDIISSKKIHYDEHCMEGEPTKAQIFARDVQHGSEYRFRVMLSNKEEVKHTKGNFCTDPPALAMQSNQIHILAAMMKNIDTMDMVFTFGIGGSDCNVGLWVHQQVLAQQSDLARLIEKLKVTEGSPSDSAVVAGIKSHHVTGYSLESYCCLVRFLYTSEISTDVDLNDFAIGCPPTKPFSLQCKERPAVQGLFSVADPPTTESGPDSKAAATPSLKRSSSFGKLFQLADCFDIKELRDYCRDKIISSLESSNALEILFSYAYRYNDLKNKVLSVVVQNMDKMYSGDEDPFEPYADHPQRHALLTEALRFKLKNLDH